MTTHSRILAWETPWTKELGGLQSMGSQSRTQLSDWTTTTNNNIWIMTLLGTLEIFHILKQFTWEYSGRVRIFVKCEKANFISKSKDEKGNHHNTSWSILERIQLQVGSLKMSRSVSQVTELVCPSENMCTQFETCCPLHKVLLLFVLCFISILDTGIIPVNCKPLSRTYGNSQSVDKPTVSLTQNDELSQSEALFWMIWIGDIRKAMLLEESKTWGHPEREEPGGRISAMWDPSHVGTTWDRSGETGEASCFWGCECLASQSS